MGVLSDDCVLEMPGGPDPWGTRSKPQPAAHAALASRFAGLQDVHDGDDRHHVASDLGVSQGTITRTTAGGERVGARGCDLFTFRDSKVLRTESYGKMRAG